MTLAASGCPALRIPVASADMASAMLQQYRDYYGVGASDVSDGCGNIHANDGTLVARVSYNGRVWSPQGELLQEACRMNSSIRLTNVGGNADLQVDGQSQRK